MKFLFSLITIFIVSFIHSKPYVWTLLDQSLIQKYKESNISLVDCLYVINLKERKDRFIKMNAMFKQYKCNYTLVNGINGWYLPETIKRKLLGPYPIKMNGGHFGALLSHLAIVKDAYERNSNIIWLLEDDAIFLGDIKKEIPQLIKKLTKIDPDWDIFFTDTNSRKNEKEYYLALGINPRPNQKVYPLSYYLRKIKVSRDFLRIFNRYGAYSMIISKNGLKKIFNYFNKHYIWSPFDIDIHYIPEIRSYSLRKNLVTNKFDTQGDTGKYSWFNPNRPK